MSRISLKESYDDRSVIVKLARIEDKTDAVQNTCDEAVASAQASAQSALDAQSKASQSAQSALDAKASADQSAKDAKASADAVADKVSKTGTTTPQVITGTGGLQVQGDLSVGGDLTVSESGHVHLDGSDIEIAGMAIEKSGSQTILSNNNGVKITAPLDVPDSALGDTSRAVNGKRLKNEMDAYAPMVRTTGNQTVSGTKNFSSGVIFSGPFRPVNIKSSPIADTADRNRPLTCFAGDEIIGRLEISYSTETRSLELDAPALGEIPRLLLQIRYQNGKVGAYITQDVSERQNSAIVTVGMLKNMGLIQ